MRYFLSAFIFVFVGFLLVVPQAVQAQRHAGYCDDVRTTADTLDCVNRHKQDVQERLNSIFDLAGENRTEAQTVLLDKAQKSWLSYRDSQCLWEASLAENASLERIYELSCVTLLTNLHADLLATTLEMEKEKQPREFGAHPRWMNVLIHDYPDVFWRFGKWTQADLDCDGQGEQVVSGIKFKKTGKKGQETNGRENDRPEVVVAVVKSPLTGRPQTDLLYVPVAKEYDEPFLCHTDIEFALVADSMEEDSCPVLEISDHDCRPLIMKGDKGDYSVDFLSPVPSPSSGKPAP